MTDYDAMTPDEIIDAKVAIDAQIEVHRGELRRAEGVLAAKLAQERARMALQAAGFDLAADGSVLITPPGAAIGAIAGGPNG